MGWGGEWYHSNSYFVEVNFIDKRELAVQAHQDVVDLVSFSKNRIEERITSIQSGIVSTGSQWLGPLDTASSAAMNLAIGIWLLVDPRCLDDQPSITDVVAQMFPKSLQSYTSLAFDFHFDMPALEEVGGFTIIGTSCLSNHLILDERNRTLSLFSHSELLTLYRDAGRR